LGSGGVLAAGSSALIVNSPRYNSSLGAVTATTYAGFPVGTISASNSIVGTLSSGGNNQVIAFNDAAQVLAIGRRQVNQVSIVRFSLDGIFRDGFQ
jgi:hypothetical protein